MKRSFWVSSLLAAALGLVSGPGASMALADAGGDRTPNQEGTWVTPPGLLWFDFLHRFSVGPAPAYPVSNMPTFYLSTGLVDWASLGVVYSTQAGITVPRASQELELSLKQRLLDESTGAPLSLSIEEAYNLTAGSPDAEVALQRHVGNLGLTLTGRYLNNFGYRGFARTVVGAGATYALTPALSLTGDLAESPNVWLGPGPGGDLDQPVWGLGLHIAIPSSPHTLSLQVSNAGTDTLQGASTNAGMLRYGFDFTIPFSNPGQWLAIVMPKPAEPAGEAPVATPTAAPSPVGSARPGTHPTHPPHPAHPLPGASAAPLPGASLAPLPGASRAPSPQGSSPSAVPAAVTPWARSFFAARCVGCHGALGHGGFGPDLRKAAAKGDTFIATRLRNGSMLGMPPFGRELTPAQLQAMVELVKAIK